MTGAPNRDQADYWSSPSGAKWIDYEDALDTALAPVLDRLLQEAALQPGQSVLDIGCGTGASTLAAARAVGPTGVVTGADISHLLLNRARERAKQAGQTNARLVLADAQTHPFPDAAYDIAMSRFGVMFFSGPVAAFANIARALKTGGRLVFLAWGSLADNPWFAVPRQAAIDHLGAPPPGDPRAPGPMAFAEQDYVTGMLRDAGLAEVRARTVTLDLTPLGDVAHVAEFASRVGPAARVVTEMEGSEEDAHIVASKVLEALRRFETPAGVRVPATLNLFTARRSPA